MWEAKDPGAGVPKQWKERGASSGTANKEWNQKSFQSLERATVRHPAPWYKQVLDKDSVFTAQKWQARVYWPVQLVPWNPGRYVSWRFWRVSDQFQTLCPDASQTLRTHAKRKSQKRNTKGERKNEKKVTKTGVRSMSKSMVTDKVKKTKTSKEWLSWIYTRCQKPGTEVRRGREQTFKTRRHIRRNSKQGMEPKKLLIRGACYRKTPCAMIQASAWKDSVFTAQKWQARVYWPV